MGMLAALKRPFSVRALPGIALAWLPIIEFFAMGYKMACASSAMRGGYELPGWKNWKQLFLFGLGARLIQAVWLAPAALAFLPFWLNLKALPAFQEQPTLETLGALAAIKNLFMVVLLLLIVAAVFSPASVLNYVSEARFAKAFSLSVFRRMASKAYLLGWLAATAYSLLAIALLFAVFLLAGNLAQASPLLAGGIILLAELFFLWFPGITIWTLLGEAWGKILREEYYGRRA